MNIYTSEIYSFFFYDEDDEDDDDDEPDFFVFKFLHTLTVYRSYKSIYVYKGKLCRKKVLLFKINKQVVKLTRKFFKY